MSKKNYYHQKLQTKKKQHGKKKNKEQHLKDAEKDSDVSGENQTGDESVTAIETENAAPLLELYNNADNIPGQKDKSHEKKKSKDKSGQITNPKQRQAQLQEQTENSTNEYLLSSKKRKHHQTEEQSELHEVTVNEDPMKKKRKKEQRLKKAECFQDVRGENNNVCEIEPASETSEIEPAPLELGYNTKKQSRERDKRVKAKDNTDSSTDNTSSSNKTFHQRYLERVKLDPVKREQFYIKRREQAKQCRLRFKQILDGTYVEEDPVKAETIAIRIQMRQEQLQRRAQKQKEKRKCLKAIKQLLNGSNTLSETMTETDAEKNAIGIKMRQEQLQRRAQKQREKPKRLKAITQLLNGSNTLSETMTETDAEKNAIRIQMRQEQLQRRAQKQREKPKRLKAITQLLNGNNALSETMTETDEEKIAIRIPMRQEQSQRRAQKQTEKRKHLKAITQLLNGSNALSEIMTETDTSRVAELTETESSSRNYNNVLDANTPNVSSLPINNISTGNKQPERQKAKNTIADFTIDSTDSVPNLLDHFERKNLPLYRVYRRMMGKLNEYNCVEAPHFFLPGLPLNTFPEDFDGSLPSRYFEKFAYKCTMPCITTRLKNLTFNDPLTHTMAKKSDWKADVFFGVVGAHMSNEVAKTTKLNDKVYTSSEHLVSLAILLDRDPDPYFNDGYNWYYAGNGNLQVIAVNDTDCLLHSQLNRLYLSKFSRRKLITKNTPLASYDCGDENNIFETICNINNYVVIRLKHKIYILKLTTEDDALKFQYIKEIDSKLPFTGIEFDHYQKNILYITKLDGTLSIVNLDLMKCRTIELMKGSSLENNWNKVITVDQLSYCHVTRETLKIYDKRTNEVVYEFTDLKEKHSELECDDITAIQKCEDVPFVFLATNHYMFLMDLRWEGNHKPRLLRRWKHHMQNVPTYISQIKHDLNKDLICLSSQWPEDTCLISNDIDIYDKILQPTSMTLPYGLPTFETTLNAAKNRMLCVDIYHPLEQRIYTSVTGNCVMAADENVLFLTLNSLGDIFAYTLYPEHVYKDDDSLERLHEWGSTMTREKRVHKSSKVIDIAHVWKALKQVPNDYVIGDHKLRSGAESKFNEKAVFEMISSGEIDGALLDAWLDVDKDDTAIQDTTLNIDLHFSDSE